MLPPAMPAYHIQVGTWTRTAFASTQSQEGAQNWPIAQLSREVYSDSQVLVSCAAEVSECLVDIFQFDLFGDQHIQVGTLPLHVTLKV